MKRMLTICCAAALALVAAFWLWPARPKPASVVPVTGAQQIREHSSQRQSTPLTAPPISRARSKTPSVTRAEGPRQRLRTAENYFQLALSLLPQAKAGDAEAQFVVFKTFRQCHVGSAGYYGQTFDTVEKAREYAQIHNHSPEEAEKLQRQCRGFFTPGASVLGDPWEWLQKATEAQYPPAQADTASERLMQDSLKASFPPGVTPEGVVAMPPIGGEADPHALLVSALPSGDPEVLATIGQLQHMLHPEEPRQEAQIDRIAWLYVACERGNDCSNLGTTSPINCTATDTHCLGVPATLLMMAHNNWAPVQNRVDELNAALDTKQWDQLNP